MFAAITAAWLLAPAAAHCLSHIARNGETLKQLAVEYYGRPEMSMVVRAANGFVHPDDGSLTEGERIEIPEVTFHRIGQGDTWNKLADRYLAAAKRGRFLAKMNGYGKDKAPPAGAIVKVPYHLRHIFAADETLKSVTRLYYGKKKSLRWLPQYNLTRKKRFKRGDVLIVPLLDLALTEEAEQRIGAERATRYSDKDVTNQEKAIEEIAQIKKAYDDGRYIETVALAQRLIGRGSLTVPQQIGVYNYSGYAYVALGEDKLATKAFVKALELQPAMELSPITTSPKVLKVFRAARKAALATSKKLDTSAPSDNKAASK